MELDFDSFYTDTKLCSVCRQELPLTEFGLRSPGSRAAGRPASWCKDCCRKASRARYQEIKGAVSEKAKADWAGMSEEERAAESFRHRTYVLNRVYGITAAQWQDMFDAQGGKCGICKKATGSGGGKRLAVDHDHNCCPGKRSCGKCVRGLLCASCNQKVGFYEDYKEEIKSWIGEN